MVYIFWNIDGAEVRGCYPEHDRFECEGLDVWMTHIGGYPGHYDRRVAQQLRAHPPQLFICGHSHILRVMRDAKLMAQDWSRRARGCKRGRLRNRAVLGNLRAVAKERYQA